MAFRVVFWIAEEGGWGKNEKFNHEGESGRRKMGGVNFGLCLVAAKRVISGRTECYLKTGKRGGIVEQIPNRALRRKECRGEICVSERAGYQGSKVFRKVAVLGPGGY